MAKVFTPGATTQSIVDWVNDHVGAARGVAGPTPDARRCVDTLAGGPRHEAAAVDGAKRTDAEWTCYEYQAKELFAKHGVPVLAGEVATTRTRRGGRRRDRRAGRGQGAGQDRRPGQGRRREARRDAAEAAEKADGDPRHGHQGPHRPPGAGHRRPATSPRSTTSPSCSTAPTGPSWRWRSVEGGMEIEEVAADQARGTGPGPDRPLAGVDAATAAEIVDAAKFPRRGRRAGRARSSLKLWEVFVGRGRDAGRGQPAGQDARRQGRSRWTARSPSTTTPASASPSTPRFADAAADDPLEARAKEKDLNYVKLDGEVGIIGNGAGLVMSTLDVVAYAGERLGGVKPANFLDIGGGASAEVMADGLRDRPVRPARVRSVFVNVFGGITACDAVANGIVQAFGLLEQPRREGRQAAGGPAGRQQRRGGPARSSPRPTCPVSRSSTRWTGRPNGPPNSRRRPRKEPEPMAIFLTEDSQVIVQGMTGVRGHRSTPAGCSPPAPTSSAASTPRKGGQKVDFERRGAPGLRLRRARPWPRPAPTSRVRLRAAPVRQGRGHRGDRRRDPAGRS